MIELREKDVEITMINIFHMFKYVQGNMRSFRGDVEYIKKTHTELLEMENIMSKMKNTPNGINSRLDISEEKKLVNLKTA